MGFLFTLLTWGVTASEDLECFRFIHTVRTGSYVLPNCPLLVTTFLCPLCIIVLTILSKVSVPTGFVLV